MLNSDLMWEMWTSVFRNFLWFYVSFCHNETLWGVLIRRPWWQKLTTSAEMQSEQWQLQTTSLLGTRSGITPQKTSYKTRRIPPVRSNTLSFRHSPWWRYISIKSFSHKYKGRFIKLAPNAIRDWVSVETANFGNCSIKKEWRTNTSNYMNEPLQHCMG